nr:hypothetical protein [Tanacetum cinerariifolium]
PVIHQPPQELSIQEMGDLKQQYLDELQRLSNLEYRDEIKIAELKENFNGMSIEIRKKEKLLQEEQWAYLSTHSSKRLHSFCFDDDDEDYISAITPDEPVLSTEEPDNSLSMEDEHLDTIPATESDEFIKSGVENLISIPSESEGIPEHVCDVPYHDNSPPLDVSKDQIEDFSESNKEFSLIDDDSFSIDDIDCVEASPPDSELVEPNSEDFTKDVVENISPTKEPQVLNTLPTHPTLELNLKFQPSSESLSAYVVWIFLPFLVYSVVPCYLLSLRNENIIFDPAICKSTFSRPDISHRCGTSGVENFIPIPSESEGIPEHVCDVPSHDNSPPLDVSKDQIEGFSESNNKFSSIDDDSFSIDNIDYVEASPPDSELVSSEVMEIVLPEVGGIDDDILLMIEHDDLCEKLRNVNLLISKIEALNANSTPSSDCKTKSSSSSLTSLLEETNTFDNSLPEFETFCFNVEEISTGSTTTHSDLSLPEYEAFYDDHVKEISSDSLITPSDISLSEYDS